MLKKLSTLFTVITLTACTHNPTTPSATERPLVGVTQFEVNMNADWYQVMAWYPASAKGERPPMPYAEKWLNKALAKQYGIPSFLSGGEKPSISWQDAPVQTGEFPVIIFNHGWQAFARSNMTQMELLAQHGYIVMSINHPGDSVLIKRLDGTFVAQSDTVKNSIKADKNQLDAIANHFGNLKTADSVRAYHAEINLLQEEPLYQPIGTNFHQWVARTQHLVSAIRQRDTSHLPEALTQHIAANKVGLLGHSFGGAVSGLVALQDKNHLPAVVLDAPQFTFDLPINNTEASILYLTGTELKFGKKTVSNESLNRALTNDYPNVKEVNFHGASHMNFTDLNHIRPLKWMGVLGSVDNHVFWQSMNESVLTFFDNQFGN